MAQNLQFKLTVLTGKVNKMSAFICSDLHLSTIAIYIHHLNDNIGIQELADKLKSINIDSVNYRYNEKTRKTKCKITDNYENVKYSKYDIIRLIQCWDYQACEKNEDFDYEIIKAFLLNYFSESDKEIARNESNLWSI